MVVERCDHSADFYEVLEGLEALIRVQAEGAQNLPPHLHYLDRSDFRTAALGAFVELGELVNEAQWKPWRQYEEPTMAERQRVLKELADVLHFLPWMVRNLVERFGITTDDVALAFFTVHEENIARFRGRVPGRLPPSLDNRSRV